jgi:organic hydroperoxide reductase OsmC/OhrA
MAAAQAACYAMALNGTLGRKSASADRTHVTATIRADKGDAGIKIVSSRLTVTAYGLTGLEAAGSTAAAEEAGWVMPGIECLSGDDADYR